MAFKELIENILPNLYRINTKIIEYSAPDNPDYIKFFTRLDQRDKDFSTEFNGLLVKLNPKWIDEEKLKLDAGYKQQFHEVVLALDRDIAYFKAAPNVDKATQDLCDEALVVVRKIESELGMEVKSVSERKL